LLQVAHLGGQGGLVAYGAGHAPQQGRHFGARLGEAEDVVDEQQQVLAFFIPEVLGEGQPGQAYPQPGPGRLVHLAEDHGGLVQDARFLQFQVQVVAFPGALAYAGEDGEAAVLVGHVVDQFLDQYRLAYTGAAEEADLAAPGEGADEVDDLDARLQNLHRRADVGHVGRRPVEGVALFGLGLLLAVDGFTHHVEHAAQGLAAHGHADGRALVDALHAAAQAVGGSHGDAAHHVVAQVLGHFQHQGAVVRLDTGPVGFSPRDDDGVVDFGQVTRGEFHVHYGPDDLGHPADVLFRLLSHRRPTPSLSFRRAPGGPRRRRQYRRFPP